MKRVSSKAKNAPKPYSRHSQSTQKRAMAKKGGGAQGGSFARNESFRSVPPGYDRHGDLLIPSRISAPVPPSKIRRGLVEARRQIDETLNEIVSVMTEPYSIKEIKLVASFSADGKFMGLWVGGAASIEITICPCNR